MISSIANSLGFGSGIDVAKLVSDLAAASRTPKVQVFDARARAVEAKISTVAQARSDLESFSTSLADVVAGGTLQSQPSVSDETALSAVAAPGVRLGNFAGEIMISQLARSQSLYSASLASKTEAVGQGTMTLSVGGQDFAIVINSANDSLTGLSDAINASGSGVVASIVNDAGGARLVLKGVTGSSGAFALSVGAGSDPALERFTYPASGAGMTLAQSAQDAAFTLDGIPYTRPSNSFNDVVPGVTLTLKKAGPGTPIAIGSQRPLETLRSTLGDFVSVFNQLKKDIAAARTATGGDQALRTLDDRLSRFLGQAVTSDSEINSLSDIGVKTNRDGSISIDQVKFEAVLAAHPDAVEGIFSPTRSATQTAETDPGLGGAFKTLVDAMTAQDAGLSSLKARLAKESASIAANRQKMEAREIAYEARLTKQFGSMDARVNALKATQSYLEQQIKIWNQDN
jgi:flagellar hook-associated protein 2